MILEVLSGCQAKNTEKVPEQTPEVTLSVLAENTETPAGDLITKTQQADTVLPATEFEEKIAVTEKMEYVLDAFSNKKHEECLLYTTPNGKAAIYNMDTKKTSNSCNLMEKGTIKVHGIKLVFRDEGKFIFFSEGNKGDKIKYYIHVVDSALSHVQTYPCETIFPNAFYPIGYNIFANGDGSKLYYYNFGGTLLYEYSFADKKQTVTDMNKIEGMENVSIMNGVVSKDGRYIAFLGGEMNVEDYMVYGIIDLSKMKATIKHTTAGTGYYMHQAGEIMYLTDSQDAESGKVSGEVICWKFGQKEPKFIKVDNLESTRACISSDLRYVASASNLAANEPNRGYKGRVYAYSTGDVVWEKDMQGSLAYIYFIEDKVVYVSEQDGNYVIYRYQME